MATRDDDPSALDEALRRMKEEDEERELAAMSDDEVARSIDAEGGDAKGIGERGAKLAAALLERRKRLAWQADAAALRARALARIAARPKRERGTRAEMVARIQQAQRDLGFAIAAAFRKGGVEAATDDELAAMVDEIALLEELHEGEPQG
jgi:hypothetical protein